MKRLIILLGSLSLIAGCAVFALPLDLMLLASETDGSTSRYVRVVPGNSVWSLEGWLLTLGVALLVIGGLLPKRKVASPQKAD